MEEPAILELLRMINRHQSLTLLDDDNGIQHQSLTLHGDDNGIQHQIYDNSRRDLFKYELPVVDVHIDTHADKSIGGHLDANGDTSIGEHLDTHVDTIVGGHIDTYADISVGGHIDTNADSSIREHIDINADTTVGGHIDTSADINVGGYIATNADTSFRGHIATNADTRVRGHIDTNADTRVRGHIDTNADTSVREHIDINGDTSDGGHIDTNMDTSVTEHININADTSVGGLVDSHADASIGNITVEELSHPHGTNHGHHINTSSNVGPNCMPPFKDNTSVKSIDHFLISQVAHVTHRIQPGQGKDVEYEVTNHKLTDILDKPFMCAVCGKIYCTTSMLHSHVISEHCLMVSSENEHSRNWEGGVTGNDLKESKSNAFMSGINSVTESRTLGFVLNSSETIPETNRNLSDVVTQLVGSKCQQSEDPNRKRKQKSRKHKKSKSKGDRKDRVKSGKEAGSSVSTKVIETGKDLVVSEDKRIPTVPNVAKVFQCEFCDEVFTSNKFRYKHRVASHPDCTFVCPSCNKTYTVNDKDKWQHHMRIHNKRPPKPKPESYPCEICSISFSTASSIAIHIQTFHPECESAVKPFCCEICGKLYRTKRAVKLHQTLVHSDARPFLCTTCGRRFKMEAYLKLHIRTHTGEKPYTCIYCAKSFLSSAGRRCHERNHTNEQPYKCSFCDRRFKCKPQMVEHQRTHTNERPFVCDICSKSFASRTSYTTHKFLHTGQKPYKCQSCPRAFAQKSNLNYHVRSIHTHEKPYPCTVCGLRFSRNTSRNIHMEKKHNMKITIKQGRPPIYQKANIMDNIVQAISIDVNSDLVGVETQNDDFSLVIENLMQ